MATNSQSKQTEKKPAAAPPVPADGVQPPAAEPTASEPAASEPAASEPAASEPTAAETTAAETTAAETAAAETAADAGTDGVDVKAQMRLALDRKRAQQAAGRGGNGAAGAKIGAGNNRAVGGKREFRRKSGG